jgi:hypothetical protein
MSLNRQKCSFFPEKKKKKEEKVMRHMFIHLTEGAREREREYHDGRETWVDGEKNIPDQRNSF